MFFDMIEAVAAKQTLPGQSVEKAEARSKAKSGRKSKVGRLESNADAFLAQRGYDVNGNPK